MKIEYRATYFPDKADCYRLYLTTGWNGIYRLSENQYFDSILSSAYLVTAYDGDELVGLGRTVSDGALYALIVDLIVLPEYQNQGIGSGLLQRLVEYCKSQQIRDVMLFAAKGKSTFYGRFGFVARQPDAPGMTLRLCQS